MSAICEICGKEFKTTQGLRGHKTFVHQIASSKEPTAQPVTEQQLAELEDRLQKLESMTGLKEPSALDRLLGTDKPITTQLEQHTRELSELHKQVSGLTEQLKLISRNTELKAELPKLADRTKAGLDKISGRLALLERYIQLEVAGVQDAVVWQLSLDRSSLKRKD